VCGECGKIHFSFYDRKTRLARDLSSGDRRIYLEYELRRVECGACVVKQERLDFLASNAKFTVSIRHAPQGKADERLWSVQAAMVAGVG